MSNNLPLISFGVIADMHYLDTDNGSNFDKTKIRRFRQSLSILKEANKSFQKNHFNITLGDILDGRAKTLGMEISCLETIQEELKKYNDSNWYYTLGNHEFYNFNRLQIYDNLFPSYIQNICPVNRLYYSFIPVAGYRCIVLDGYEISTIGAITPEYQQYAEDLIRARNHNYAAGSNDWLHNLAPENLRYLPFNGGVTNEQLEWLKSELKLAIENHEKCIIFSHMALYAPASQEQNVIFNCEEILSILHSTPPNTVLLCIAGHDHDGGYAVDTHGIHHMVPCSPIECDEGEVSYGSIHIFSNEIHVDWKGKVPQRIWSEKIPIVDERYFNENNTTTITIQENQNIHSNSVAVDCMS